MITFTLPNRRADFRYRYRDTGGSWSIPVLMNAGVHDHLAPWVSPVCDELEIEASYTDTFTFTRCFLSGLSLTGLGVTVDAGGSQVASITQTERNQIIRFAQTSAGTMKVTITGVNQNKLDLAQLVFGDVGWQPPHNYENGATLKPTHTYNRSQSHGGASQSRTSRLRSHNCEFRRIPDSSYQTLVDLVDYESDRGLVLFEKDDQENMAYLAFIGGFEVQEEFVDLNSFSAEIMEAIA